MQALEVALLHVTAVPLLAARHQVVAVAQLVVGVPGVVMGVIGYESEMEVMAVEWYVIGRVRTSWDGCKGGGMRKTESVAVVEWKCKKMSNWSLVHMCASPVRS